MLTSDIKADFFEDEVEDLEGNFEDFFLPTLLSFQHNVPPFFGKYYLVETPTLGKSKLTVSEDGLNFSTISSIPTLNGYENLILIK